MMAKFDRSAWRQRVAAALEFYGINPAVVPEDGIYENGLDYVSFTSDGRIVRFPDGEIKRYFWTWSDLGLTDEEGSEIWEATA